MKTSLETIERIVELIKHIKEENNTQSNLEALRIMYMITVKLLGHSTTYPSHIYKGTWNISLTIEEGSDE